MRVNSKSDLTSFISWNVHFVVVKVKNLRAIVICADFCKLCIEIEKEFKIGIKSRAASEKNRSFSEN